eukprot:8751088-Pyramimonas_sp.AAC.1
MLRIFSEGLGRRKWGAPSFLIRRVACCYAEAREEGGVALVTGPLHPLARIIRVWPLKDLPRWCYAQAEKSCNVCSFGNEVLST